jgi:putative FmdB family regulatory protein
MPIYAYLCQACHREVEVLQKVSDGPLLDCPECGEPSLKKRVTAAAFRLKGGGWYETDFKKGDNKKNLAGTAEASSGEASSGSGDKKPADAGEKTSVSPAKTANPDAGKSSSSA